MTKRKSKLLQGLVLLGVFSAMIGVLMLTGCGESQENANTPQTENSHERVTSLEAVAFYPEAAFITSDIGVVTNQEALDIMIEWQDATTFLLNIVDDVMLRGTVSVDSERTVGFWESYKESEGLEDEDALAAWLARQGFADEAAVIAMLELNELRTEAIRPLITIEDEEIQEIVDEFFADTDDLEETWTMIYETLMQERAGEIMHATLADMRQEAGFVIFNDTLREDYEQLLGFIGATFEVNQGEPNDAQVVAQINEIDITIGHLFEALSRELGFLVLETALDGDIIRSQFSVDAAEVDEMMEEYREEFGDEFDAVLEGAGFETEADFWTVLEEMLLGRAMLEARLETPSDETLMARYEMLSPTVSGSHILVDDYDFAQELIARLEAADDFESVFAELAQEYSDCPSGANGGDLGSWERGQMVPEFDNAVFNMAVGDFTSEPVETQFGFHIIFKTGEETLLSFEEMREDLLADEILRLQNTPGVVEGILNELRKEVNVVFANPILQGMLDATVE